MLEDVAAYRLLAPVAASVVLGVTVAAFWLAGRRPTPARIRVRYRR
jgi:hypothetical protein